MRTVGGVGQFSLASGAASGPIVLEFTTDRADNNVSNGIQDPVSSLMQVYAVDEVERTPVAVCRSFWNGDQRSGVHLCPGGDGWRAAIQMGRFRARLQG